MVMRCALFSIIIGCYGVHGADVYAQQAANIMAPPAGIALTDRPIAPASDQKGYGDVKKPSKTAMKTKKNRAKTAPRISKKHPKKTKRKAT